MRQGGDEERMLALMGALETNLRAESRSWSQYDHQLLTEVLSPVQVRL